MPGDHRRNRPVVFDDKDPRHSYTTSKTLTGLHRNHRVRALQKWNGYVHIPESVSANSAGQWAKMGGRRDN